MTRYLILISLLALAGCVSPSNCVGDPGTVCDFQMHLDAAKRLCTIIDVRDPNPNEYAGVYSASHANGALYCDPQGWRSR
jgi:hypothetical protein